MRFILTFTLLSAIFYGTGCSPKQIVKTGGQDVQKAAESQETTAKQEAKEEKPEKTLNNFGSRKVFRIGVLGNTVNSVAQAAFNAVELMAEEKSTSLNTYGVEAKFFNEDENGVRNSIRNTSDMVALIGCFGESHSDILRDLDGLPLISICSQMQDFTEKENAFRVCASEKQLAQIQAKVDIALFGRKKFAVIYEEGNEEYAKIAEAYAETVKANKGIISQYRSVKPDRTDFSNILIFLRDKKTRVIFYIGSYENAARVGKQSKELNVGAILTSTSNIFTKQFVKRAKIGAEGAEFATKTPPSLWKIKGFASFNGRYNKKYKESSKYLPYAHDAVSCVFDALDNGSHNKKDVLRHIKTSETDSVHGRLKFDEKGNREDPPFYFYVVRRGEFWPYPIKGDKRLKFDAAK